MNNRTLLRGLLLVLFIGVVTAAYAVLEVVIHGASLHAALVVSASFGCFGALLGGIFAFDPESEMKVKPSAAARIGVGLAAGAAAALVWNASGEAVALAGFAGGTLGYFGMSWAKYVDF